MSAADRVRELIGDAGAASDLLIIQLAECTVEREGHKHPIEGRGPDLYCLNLTSYMGHKMPFVLRRLVDAEAEIEQLKARYDALADEATGYLELISELESGGGR